MSTRLTLLFPLILLAAHFSAVGVPTALLETMYFGDPAIRIEGATCQAAWLDLGSEDVVVVARDEGGSEAIYTSPDGVVFVEDSDLVHDPRWIEWPGVEGTWLRIFVSGEEGLLALRAGCSGVPERIELIGDLPVGAVSHAFALSNLSGDTILLSAVATGTMSAVLTAPLMMESPDRLVLGSSDATGIVCDSRSSFGTCVLSDGRMRVYTSDAGRIVSWISDDGGVHFTAEAGIRVSPDDFAGLPVQSLSDPRCVHLADGRYRLYMTGFLLGDDGVSTPAILSATAPVAVW
ncbi:hypothetical protein JW848_00625 [Candidatus Bipolaricaulota bacterium]|nr:hypothetical protein [Candidatus Bipolaricaulota bacterium]